MLLLDRTVPRSRSRRFLGFLARHRLSAAALVVILLVVAVIDVRLFVAPTSDAPARTDAIVVLGGATFTDRLHAAIELAKRYRGTPLVVSTPGNVRCPDADDVPTTTHIICFRPDPSSTQGEAQAAAELAKKNHWTSMSVVTTADQIWRARLRFTRCYAGSLRMIQAPTSTWVRLGSVPYEMGATLKAELLQRGC